MVKYLLSTFFFSFIFITTLLGQNDTSNTYIEYTLDLFKDKLEGSSVQLEGYNISMNIPQGYFRNGLNYHNLISFIQNQKVSGSLTSSDGKSSEIKYEIVPYKDSLAVLMKTSTGWFLWEKIKVESKKLTFLFNWWYCPPATKMDLEILNLAESLLADSTCWHKNDDRKCEDDEKNNTWSLFCALKYSSIKAMKEYNHHNTAMQTVRFIIDDLLPDHGFEHTLMNYNNSPSTTYQDIIKVIELAKKRIQQELEKNK